MNGLCPSTESLNDFLGGGLPAEQETALSHHITGCRKCQARLDTLTAPHLAIPQSPPPLAAPPDPRFIRQLQFLDPSLLDSATPPPASDRPPITLLKKPEVPGYEIIRELGRGGMGVVYLAKHRLLGRNVAVKMIPADLYPTDADRARFRAEAEAIAGLRHPNVVELYEFGEKDGRSFLVLEFADGGTLRERTLGHPQPPRLVAELVESLARGVQSAHEHSIAHRDLKPGNVLLFSNPGRSPSSPNLSDFTAKISDFGVARRLDTTDLYTRSLVGSPAYMAPEQVPDDSQHTELEVGPAADIHALGVMLYELLTGRPPFLGADWMTVLMQIRRREPIPPRQLVAGIPVDLQTICLKCLNKEPNQRYATAGELAGDLQRFLEGRPIVARPIGAVRRFGKWMRRRPVLASALFTAAFGVVFSFAALIGMLISFRAQNELERQVNEKQTSLLAEAEAGLYRSRITQASLHWREGDLFSAREALEHCDSKLRGWEWRYLNGICHGGEIVLTLPKDSIVHRLCVPQGRIASLSGRAGEESSAPATLMLWNPTTGRPQAVWNAPHSAQNAEFIRVNNLPRLLSIGAPVGKRDTSERIAVLWNLSDVTQPEVSATPMATIAFSGAYAISDLGRTLVTATETDHVLVWNLISDSVTATELDPQGKPAHLAVNSTGTVVVASVVQGNEHEMVDWVLPSESPFPNSRWQSPPMSDLILSPLGTHLASKDSSHVIHIRSTSAAPTSYALHSRQSHPGTMQFDTSSRFIVIRDKESAAIFDRQFAMLNPLTGSTSDSAIRSTAMGQTNGTGIVATGTERGTIQLWNLRSGHPYGGARFPIRAHAGPVNTIQFIADRGLLVSGGTDGTIRVWNLHRDQTATSLATNFPPGPREWDHTGNYVVAAAPGRLEWFDAIDPDDSTLATLAGCPSDATMALASHGERVVALGDSLQVWDVPEPKRGEIRPAQSIPLPPGFSRTMSVSNDGRFAFLSWLDPTPQTCIGAWNLRTGEMVWQRGYGTDIIESLVASPNGDMLIVDAALAPPKLLDGRTGRDRQSLIGAAQHGRTFAFDPTGQQIAVAGLVGEIGVWTATESRPIWTQRILGGSVGVAFLPNDSRLAVADMTGNIDLMDGKTGNLVLRMLAPSHRAPQKAWNPFPPRFRADGQRLLSHAHAGSTLIWDAPLDRDAIRNERRQLQSK